MKNSSLTDSSDSINANEFVWVSPEASTNRPYTSGPVIRALRDFGAKTVLDLGCGNGQFTGQLTDLGFQAVGVDMSSSGIEIARKTRPDLEFDLVDIAEDLPEQYCGRFDSVVAVEVVEHLLLPRQLMQRAAQALKPGGSLIVTAPYHGYLKNLALAVTNQYDHHWQALRDYGHVKFFSKRTLCQLFEECGFTVTSVQGAGRLPLLAKSMVITGKMR